MWSLQEIHFGVVNMFHLFWLVCGLRSERMEEWMGHVEETLDGLERVPNIEIASKHRPWEL